MIIHIDMDAFYASVEQLDNPDLKGKCLIIGGTSYRSVVSTASYEARKYGVHSAMPIYQAKQRCPQAIFLPPRMERYKEISNQIMFLLNGFSPLVEPVSIDEAYVDITGCSKLFGGPEKIAVEIKKKIKACLQLSCSVGIAPNKFLAKIASDLNKPDGLTLIMPHIALEFIESLPIQKVPGVGQERNRILARMGIRTLGDVKNYPLDMLFKKLGKYGKRLLELSYCIDNSPVSPLSPNKSISSEHTLFEDTSDVRLLNRYLLIQAEEIGRDLRRLNMRAKTITLKIKHADFEQVTRSLTVDCPTKSTVTIYKLAQKILSRYKIIKKIRLVGLAASNLVSADLPVQMDLFKTEQRQGRKWEKVDRAIDVITRKYGKDIIKRASLTED
ncbi:MAG: DNA polymerase IV [Desulfobacterales bacterium]|nr:DNA polymerase IV [Desulfobacterales bacterium]